jgi:hypothetical protein
MQGFGNQKPHLASQEFYLIDISLDLEPGSVEASTNSLEIMGDICPYFVTQWAIESGSPYPSCRDFLAHTAPVTEIHLKQITLYHKRL